MKSKDLIAQLAGLLPLLTDKFTTNYNVLSLTRTGTTVTVTTTTAHTLAVGQQVSIVGAKTPLIIATLTRSGAVGTLVTTGNHDMTENFSLTAEIAGAVEAEFNGTFTVLQVLNRKTVTFTMPASGAIVATGAPLLLNGASELQGYGGLYAVSVVPNTTSFEYEIVDNTLFTPAAGTIFARTNPRISGAATVDRAISAYTKQALGELWAFVVLGDVFASKSRAIESDGVDNIQLTNNYRQQLIHPFSVYVICPAVSMIAAREARDDAVDMLPLLCGTLLFSRFDSRLYVGAQNPVVFSDHGLYAYDSTTYVHVYNFQATADLLFEDTVGYALDVAFRDIDTTINLDVGTSVATAKIDLDEVIL